MKKLSFLSCFLFLATYIFAQPTYQKYFGVKGNEDYDCSTMIPGEDGSVVALGQSIFSKKSNKWDIDFVKLDPSGNIVMQKRFYTDLSCGDAKGIPTSDGGYLLFTSQHTLKPFGVGGAALIKLNNNAVVEWAKYYNSVTYRSMKTYAVIQSKSGDYFIHYGLSDDYLTQNEMGIMKISQNGSILWDTTFFPTIPYYYEYFGTSLLETSNGKILCGGYLQTEDPWQDYRSSLIELNADGSFEKALYFRSKYETPFQLEKIYQINREIVLYGSGYSFNINMETPEFITGTNMSFQYFLYRKYPSLRPQQLGGTCYFANGSIVNIFRGYPTSENGYDVVVNKYDSLYRICPLYNAQDVNENTTPEKFQLRKLTVYMVSDNYTVSDIAVYDSTLNFVYTVCSGEVPSLPQPTLKSQENISKPFIYPNPVDNILHVQNLDAGGKYQLKIMDNLGNVFQQFTVEHRATYDFKLSGLKAGIYYVKIQSTGTNTSLMFIKK